MNSTTLPYLLALVIVLSAGFAVWKRAASSDQTEYLGEVTRVESVPDDPIEPDRPPLAQFELEEPSGRTLRSQALLGKVWLGSFFFSSCPSACIKQNQALADIYRDAEFADLRMVSITCDPVVDTPEVLGEYAQRFGADPERWHFCRGDLDYVQRIGQDVMKLAIEHQTHSDRAAVFDRTGKVRGRFRVTDPNQLVLLKALLVRCLEEEL